MVTYGPSLAPCSLYQVRAAGADGPPAGQYTPRPTECHPEFAGRGPGGPGGGILGLVEADADLDRNAYNRYPTLTEDEIKTLVVDDKWLAVLEARTRGEVDHITQTLTRRVKELAERYEMPMPEIEIEVSE